MVVSFLAAVENILLEIDLEMYRLEMWTRFLIYFALYFAADTRCIVNERIWEYGKSIDIRGSLLPFFKLVTSRREGIFEECFFKSF